MGLQGPRRESGNTGPPSAWPCPVPFHPQDTAPSRPPRPAKKAALGERGPLEAARQPPRLGEGRQTLTREGRRLGVGETISYAPQDCWKNFLQSRWSRVRTDGPQREV